MKDLMYCGKYKTKKGAENYVARQTSEYRYVIQPTVTKNPYWIAGDTFRIVYCVYLGDK